MSFAGHMAKDMSGIPILQGTQIGPQIGNHILTTIPSYDQDYSIESTFHEF